MGIVDLALSRNEDDDNVHLAGYPSVKGFLQIMRERTDKGEFANAFELYRALAEGGSNYGITANAGEIDFNWGIYSLMARTALRREIDSLVKLCEDRRSIRYPLSITYETRAISAKLASVMQRAEKRLVDAEVREIRKLLSEAGLGQLNQFDFRAMHYFGKRPAYFLRQALQKGQQSYIATLDRVIGERSEKSLKVGRQREHLRHFLLKRGLIEKWPDPIHAPRLT